MRRRARRFPWFTWAHRLSAAGFLALLVLAGRGGLSWLHGSLSATRVAGRVPFADPLAALEVTLAARTLAPTLLVGAGILLVLYAILGRVFCGWLCPLGLVLDLFAGVRLAVARWLRRRGWAVPSWRLPGGIKYGVLAGLLLAAAVTSVSLYAALSPITLTANAFVFGAGVELLVPGLILGLEALAPRAFCRALCPLGALYALVGRFAPFRVRVGGADGEQLFCRQCTLRCPMGIRVMEDHVLRGKDTIDDPECTRCGTCLDHCRGDMLHYRKPHAALPSLPVLPPEPAPLPCPGEAPGAHA